MRRLTFCVVVLSLTVAPISAEAYDYRINMWADADPYYYSGSGDTIVFDQSDGVTSATVDTGWRLGDLGTEAKGRASANLATGGLRVYVGARGKQIYKEASAGARASFYDSLTFDLPEGTPSAAVEISLAVEGAFDLYNASNSTTGADASLWFWEIGVPRVINEQVTIYDGYSGSGSGVPVTLDGTAVVEEGKSYMFYASLAAGVKTQNPDNLSYFDFANPAALAIVMPAGVIFDSGSGVLLSQPIPEPSTLALLCAGVVALCPGLRRRSRILP